MTDTVLFDIQKLQVSFYQKKLLNIDHLSLPKNQHISIIGANGAGKSTFIHALLGQITGCQVQGQIQCFGKPIEQMIKQGKVAWVGQHERFEVPLTVLDYALLGIMPNLAWYQTPSQENIDIAYHYLADFELTHLAKKRVQTLSGGERQRLAIVRALMQNTEILLLDEPTNHLDIKYQRSLFAYLTDLIKNTNKSIVTVLHSLTQAYQHADHVIAIANGEVLASDKPDVVMTAERLKQMYQVDIQIYDTDDGKIFV